MNQRKDVRFEKKLLMLGCGLIGQGVLPLIFRHIDIKPDQVTIITADERGREVADYYKVAFLVQPLTPENYRDVLAAALTQGDFLLNLSSDVESNWLIDYFGEHGILFLDTCIDSWLGAKAPTHRLPFPGAPCMPCANRQSACARSTVETVPPPSWRTAPIPASSPISSSKRCSTWRPTRG